MNLFNRIIIRAKLKNFLIEKRLFKKFIRHVEVDFRNSILKGKK